uniref:MyTH4 domain-containing protein n=1 Tax=Gopherus agassizii TaxID=38772 RepID=A0A452H2K3_9SAUR
SCLAALMRFMGDQPTLKNQAEIDYIYEILQVCGPPDGNMLGVLCFSVPCRESCIQGWRLLSLLTGFFLPSNTLMPYATKFLQQASTDPANLARTCYGNLRKMIMYGGRRHLPFRVEMEALLVPGNEASSICSLFGRGVCLVPRVKTTHLPPWLQVAAEVVQEICEQMGINEQEEIQEFALFASKNDGKVVRPVHQYEYIHDYLLEDSSVILDLRRLSWKTPLHFENEIYISVHYSQVQQDYLKGKLLLNYNSELEKQVGTMALFQHWARGLGDGELPLSLLDLQTSTWVGAAFSAVSCSVLQILDIGISTVSLPAEHVIQLPLFGYNAYPVERCSEPRIPLPCVLGVNSDQIVIVASRSQELCCHIPLKERMRTLRPLDDSGVPGLEVNYGSVDNPQTMWFELHQVKRTLSTACYWPCNECSYWDNI